MNLSKLLVVIASLSAFACEDGVGHDNAPPPGEVACTGIGFCRSGTRIPVCGDPISTVCARYVPNYTGTSGLCSYRLIDSPTCGCIEGAVQYCRDENGFLQAAGGGPSLIQDCLKTGSQSTSWGGCHG